MNEQKFIYYIQDREIYLNGKRLEITPILENGNTRSLHSFRDKTMIVHTNLLFIIIDMHIWRGTVIYTERIFKLQCPRFVNCPCSIQSISIGKADILAMMMSKV